MSNCFVCERAVAFSPTPSQVHYLFFWLEKNDTVCVACLMEAARRYLEENPNDLTDIKRKVLKDAKRFHGLTIGEAMKLLHKQVTP